jgi:dTDP-4-amino-4,6-dideoxygalactose transaminase
MPTSRLNSIPRFALPYTAADFASALAALGRPTPPPDAFGLLGPSPKFWTGSGRQALRLLLTALALKPGAGVALPLFTDPSLVHAIAVAGYRPIFIDIDPSFLTIDPESLAAVNGTFAAVVAVHLFGQLADMPAVMAIAGKRPVIEDAAHAPLSCLNGRRAGEFGLASFFSFASTKYWPAGGGGLAMVHDPALARAFAEAAASLAPTHRLRELRNLLMQGAKAVVFRRRCYGFIGRPLRRWAEKWALLEPHLDLDAIPRPYAAVARRQASGFALRVEFQRANSLRLLSRLSGVEDIVLPMERVGARYNYHMFPVLLHDRRERDAVTAGMWRRHVDTSTIYCAVVEECRRFGYTGGCPVAESVADRLITLPNYAGLNAEDIDRVAEAFLISLRAWRSARSAAWPAVRLEGRRPAGERELPAPAPVSLTDAAERQS